MWFLPLCIVTDRDGRHGWHGVRARLVPARILHGCSRLGDRGGKRFCHGDTPPSHDVLRVRSSGVALSVRFLLTEFSSSQQRWSIDFFFAECDTECEGKVSPGKLHRRRHLPYEKRASRNTSCTDGMSAPVPWTERRSNKDSEKARAAEHANTALQRRMYAAWTLPCNTRGDSRALALAKADKKVAVSSFQRPPTSAARTTKRARPSSPDSSGWVRSFRRPELHRCDRSGGPIPVKG